MGVFAIRILLFASILFGMSLTDGNETPIDSNFTPIPFDAVEFNIFGDTKHTFETSVNATLKTVRNFFKTRVAEAAFGMGHVFVTTLPIIKPFNRFVTAFRSILEDESEWKELFSKTVVNETKREIVKERIVWMKSTLKIMQEKMNVLNETNPDFDNRKAVASIIHSSFDKMINYFAHRDALFKKYPLIGVVPLIELASLVTIFHPLSEILIPFQTKSPQIACKLNDILLDYRTRAVDARLDRLHTKNESDMIQFRSIITTVQTIPYNLNGYSEQKLLKCARGCDNSTNFICIRDEFGPAEFSAVHEDCLKEYAGLVRHRVEEMFPIELLHELCGDRKPNTPTGYGWLTVKVKNVCAYGRADGLVCLTAPCDPLIKVFVYVENVVQKRMQPKTDCFNADITYLSKRISANSTIKIEIWDDDTTPFGPDLDLVQREEGSIGSFMEKPVREGALIPWRLAQPLQHIFKQNSIEMAVFWEDEFYE